MKKFCVKQKLFCCRCGNKDANTEFLWGCPTYCEICFLKYLGDLEEDNFQMRGWFDEIRKGTEKYTNKGEIK